ncbi:MAG: hypothetical protein HZA27_02975 [Candidatus Omnitrophica bacterium]|nr:hypothetical protein [Candidatus Omnitrophota bacterium]
MKKIFVALVFLSFFVPCLKAEDKTTAECLHKLDTYVRYMPSRSARAQTGDVAITESQTEYAVEFKAWGKLPLELSLANQYIGIAEDTAVGLPAQLTALNLGLQATLPFFKVDKTYLRFKLIPSFYADTWSFHTSSFRLPAQVFLIYQPQEKFTFIAGVAVYPEFESEVLPILGMIYKPNDKLTFNLVPKRPNISYALNERLTLFAEGGISFGEFEVTKDNLKSANLIYKENRLGTGMKLKLNKYMEASVSCGGVFNRYLKYKDSLGKVGIKDGFYSELRIEAGF